MSANLGLKVLKAVEFPLTRLRLPGGHRDRMRNERKLGQQYRLWKYCHWSTKGQSPLLTNCVTLNKLFKHLNKHETKHLK